MMNRLIVFTTALLMAFTGLTPAYAAPGDNLLTNGGFENSDAGWWSYANAGTHTRAVVQELVGAAVTETPIEGESCLHLTTPVVPQFWDAGFGTSWPGSTLEVGKHYTLSAFLKAKAGTMQINMKIEDQTSYAGHGEQMMTITEEWAEYSITSPVIDAEVNPAGIVFHMGAQAGEFWVDAVRFYEGDYVPPDIIPHPQATKPVPTHQSVIPPTVFEDNVYVTLDYKPGEGAITHTGYFSDNRQDVVSRDTAHSLGNPPYPAQDEEMFYVGYDAPEVAPFARTPLVRGTTYYWAIDEFNGVSTTPGDVWSFTVMTIQAWGPEPADGEGLVTTDGTMTWNIGDLVTTNLTLRYHIYVGTDETAVAAVATGDTASPLYVATVSEETHDYADLPAQTEHFWRVDTSLAISRPPFTATITKGDVWDFSTAPVGTGSILREVWLNQGGGSIDGLRSEPNFPDDPDITTEETLFEAPQGFQPTGVDIAYGQRLHGWLVVGQTGDYTFWTVADDMAELWLSTDMSPDNAVLVSQCTAWTNSREFDNPNVIPSDPIHLEGGQQYYISGLMIEGVGGDNFSAAWQGPDTGGLRMVIPGKNLKPFKKVTATNPDPANNSTGNPQNVTLSWDAGIDESTGAPYTIQHIYVGSDPIAVADATTSSPEYKGPLTGTSTYGPLSLAYYERVYWRVDGVTDATGDVAYHGSVWNFRALADPTWAGNPDPPDGATDVSDNPTFSWTAGLGAAAHTVYFGKDDPANMVKVAGPQAGTTYTPPTELDLGTTYYWRIVESPGMGQGITWSFTTSDYRLVDDMEAYKPWTDPFGPWVFVSWKDGFGDCTPGNGNNTGAVLTEDASVFLTGLQSMKYDFDNDGLVYSPCTLGQVTVSNYYSRVEAQVAGLPSGIGDDWTRGGVKALRINFMGQLGNSTTDSFWVQLQDAAKTYGTKVFYGDYEGETLDHFADPTWRQWNIDLADFDVDLTNVVSIVIGIGNEGSATPGGSGTIHIDDIRLYTPSCTPQRAKPDADFDDNCQVDYDDVATLFDWWLFGDMPETVWTSGSWSSTDIGDVNVPGSFSDLGGGMYSITARGDDIWNQADAFHYAYKPLSGDGQMTVRVTDITGPSANDWRKAGVMIRETLDADSPHAFMCVTPVIAAGNGRAFQWRPSKGATSQSSDGATPLTMPTCVRIVRTGDTFRGFCYDAGQWLQQGNAVTIPMAEDVYIGLAATSHENAISCSATFDRTCSTTDFIPMDLIEDKVINFEDYAEMMNHWLETVLWPQ